MLKTFQNYTNANLSFLKDSKLLIAVSGGVDSVVLTHLCKASRLNVSIAHCNFNLRGDESDADEAFVIALADQLDIEVFVQPFDTKAFADQNKMSIQVAARELRYRWFQELSQQLEIDYILTGHHADDNLETFLINLTRGTGLDGLTGIPEVNNNIVRPLLKFSREAIESYAKNYDYTWREDSSNASTKYLRNKLRHDIIPVLKEINPEVLSNFNNTIANLNDTADVVEESVQAVLKRAIVSIDNTQISYKISEFIKVNNTKAYLFQVFKVYGFTQWDDMVDLLSAQSGKQLFSSTHKLLKDRTCLILTKIIKDENLTKKEASIVINDTSQSVETALGHLTFETVLEAIKSDVSTIYVDAKTLKFPLIVRHWKAGDYFYPLGMKGKKKLSKFFKDQKLSLLAKEKALLLCSKDQIIWVLNQRADDRFKVSDQTESILKIKLS